MNESPVESRSGLLHARWFRLVVFAGILVIWVAGSFPFHLDKRDQELQAYTAYELVRQGNFFYHHMPHGGVATKPPFLAWVTAGVYAVTGSWDVAWRVPSLLAGILIMVLLSREGERWMPGVGGFLAPAAFGLTMLSGRLGALMRTDMMLACLIFVPGLLILRKVRTDEPWKPWEKLVFTAFVSASLLTKGPMLHALLLPGVIVYAVLARRAGRAARVWSGWWTWVVPIAVFGFWVFMGTQTCPGFYETVVEKEFLGRFASGEKSPHSTQHVLYYLPHFLHKAAPATIFVLLMLFVRDVRRAIAREPGILWLVCWTLGGFVLMSLVPSKRVDRIYSLVPPLALLATTMVARLPVAAWPAVRRDRWIAVVTVISLLALGGYQIGEAVYLSVEKEDTLVHFGREVRELAEREGLRFEAVEAPHLGMVIYTRRDVFMQSKDFVRALETGELDAVVVDEETLKEWAPDLDPEVLLRSEPGLRAELPYLFIRKRG
jgi:4-amino-4-deoxy-L-arabinose transferase-like glycosyltransferase